MDQYLPIVLMLVLAALFAAGSFVASRVLGPHRPTAAKEGPYESGIAPRIAPASRFPVRFYLVAMIFVIFDIEVIFLYPWAVIYRQVDKFGFAEMAAFAVVVFVSFAYLVSNGALDWGPTQKAARRASPDLTRASTSATVLRVRRPAQVAAGVGGRGDDGRLPGGHAALDEESDETVPAGAPADEPPA